MSCIYFCTWITTARTSVFRVSVVSRRESLLLGDSSLLVLVRMIAEPKSQRAVLANVTFFPSCIFFSFFFFYRDKPVHAGKADAV